MDISPANFPLPELLDPVLNYLADTLPSPLYSFLINLLSHSLALFTAAFALVSSLIGTNPMEWDAQMILPPLISLLAAYLALMSLYRTTSWMLRTSFWFIKWGSILGALLGGVAYVMGNANGNGVGRTGIVSTLGGLVLDMINGHGQNAAGGSRPKSQARAPRSRTQSFEKGKGARGHNHQENGEVQKIIEDIVGAASKVMKDSGLWNAAMGFVSAGLGKQNGEEEQGDATGSTRQRRKAGTSRSR